MGKTVRIEEEISYEWFMDTRLSVCYIVSQ
jgi:hypothetical protein